MTFSPVPRGRETAGAAAVGRSLAGVLAVALLAWAAPVIAQAPRPSVDHLVAFFDTVVFGAEIDKQLASTVAAKWQGPMRIAVQGQASERHRDILTAHAATIAALTNVPIEVLPPGGADANVTAVFVPRTQMARVKIVGVSQGLIDKLAAAGGCYFLSWQKPAGTIVGAVIVVNIQREEKLITHCILEELTQSMGLPNDTDMMRPSLFSDADTLLAPSRADVVLIRSLYDPRLTAGLPRAEALKRVRPILAEWNERLPIESAAQVGTHEKR